MQVGTLDQLVGLSDDLGKLDGYVEGITRKVASYLGEVLEDQRDKLHENLLANNSEFDVFGFPLFFFAYQLRVLFVGFVEAKRETPSYLLLYYISHTITYILPTTTIRLLVLLTHYTPLTHETPAYHRDYFVFLDFLYGYG